MIQYTYIRTEISKTTNTKCTYVLGGAKPPIQYLICSSRPSNSHNIIDDLINITYMFSYDHQSSIRATTRMQFTSTTGGTNRHTVHSIMTAKALTVIVGQSSTDTMNHMAEHMAKHFAAVKTTAWGGQTWIPCPCTG